MYMNKYSGMCKLENREQKLPKFIFLLDQRAKLFLKWVKMLLFQNHKNIQTFNEREVPNKLD